MDYSPQAKHTEFPFTEVFVQIAETQNQYVVCVCVVREKKIQQFFLLVMSSTIHFFTMTK